MFVNEVSRKIGSCMMLLIMDVILLLSISGVKFSKGFITIGLPLLIVLEYFFSEWVGKKYWRNQKLSDMLTKVFVVLLLLLVIFGIICLKLAMKG